jgi:hypothetical protein
MPRRSRSSLTVVINVSSSIVITLDASRVTRVYYPYMAKQVNTLTQVYDVDEGPDCLIAFRVPTGFRAAAKSVAEKRGRSLRTACVEALSKEFGIPMPRMDGADDSEED